LANWATRMSPLLRRKFALARDKRRAMKSRVNREVQARLCVQRRLACSAGDKPAGARVRSSVAWIAERRETEFLKPIDARLLGGRASYRAVMKMNVDVASKVRISKAEPATARAKAAWTAEI